MNTSEILRNLREDKDLKQIDIANILCITQQTYSNYENAKSEIPLTHLIKLADFYNISTDFLLGRVTYKNNLTSLNDLLINNITYGDLLNNISKLNKSNLSSLIDFLNYLLSKKS
nr:helix-turn-helix transcriptional regulator [uncultured Tyzzerella sp.]